MQEKWDDLDNLILNSFEECGLSINYNEKILSKVKKTKNNSINIPSLALIVAGWALVIIGILLIINKIFPDNEIYNFIKQSIGTYFVPVIFIFVGVYLLVKKK